MSKSFSFIAFKSGISFIITFEELIMNAIDLLKLEISSVELATLFFS